MKTNYTVIIPHKNIPQLLRRCLDSIPYRDDTQIIITDDDSDPAVTDFEHFPGSERPDTEIYFTKEGRGAGYARNVGLQHAKGNRLIFADADDFFMPCFGEALDAYKDDEHDIVYFRMTSMDSETLKPRGRHKYYNRLLEKYRRANSRDVVLEIKGCWVKFIKRAIVEQNNIGFQETTVSNDVLFTAKTEIAAKSRLISDYTIYCLTYRKGSLTTIRTTETMSVRFRVACDEYNYLKKFGKEKYAEIVNYWIRIICNRQYKSAISLFPDLIATCDVPYIIRSVNRIIMRKIVKILKGMKKYE